MNKGTLTISRPRPGTTARIQIRDAASYLGFITVEVDLKDFAEALLGLSEVDCTFELRSIENVGKVRESKTEVIEIESPWSWSQEDLDALIGTYEIDGWRCQNRKDVTNPHKGGQGKQRVTFVRYVEAEQKTKEETK